jgi:hypothetical protein
MGRVARSCLVRLGEPGGSLGGRSKDLAAPCMNDTEVKSVNEAKEPIKQLQETG